MVFCNRRFYKVLCAINWCHNPYFNRWFSAILIELIKDYGVEVTILILIDGFLQSWVNFVSTVNDVVTILILIDGFLQFKKKGW